MQEHEFLCSGKKLYGRSMGEGPALVLVHGFGEDGSIWNRQFAAVKNFRLLIPDLPGSGKSEITEDMSMEGLAASLHEWLQQLGISSCTMIGHSMGGYVSLAFAEAHPGMLNALGLFHSTAFPDTEEKIATRKKGIEFINRHGAFEFLKTSTPNLYSPQSRESAPQLVEEHVDGLKDFEARALTAYYEAMIRRPDRSALLKSCPYPVLFALGRHDTAVPLKDGLTQSAYPMLSQVEIFENSGHMGMREETDKATRSCKALQNWPLSALRLSIERSFCLILFIRHPISYKVSAVKSAR